MADHINLGVPVNAALWTLFALATISVALRLGARKQRNLRIGWDDFFMFISLLLNLGANICGSVAIYYGFGQHISDIDAECLPISIHWALVAIALGILVDVFPKMAIALFIDRLLIQAYWMKIFCITWAASLIVIGIAITACSFLQCSPVSHQWDPYNVPGKCWSPSVVGNFGLFIGSYSAAQDLFFSLYPVYIVARLQMPWRKKAVVMATLSLGLLSFAITAYKCIVKLPLLKDPRVDFTFLGAQIMLWTILEGSIVIIAGSVPTWGWILGTDGFKRMIGYLHLKQYINKRHSGRTNAGAGRTTHPTAGGDDDAINSTASSASNRGILRSSLSAPDNHNYHHNYNFNFNFHHDNHNDNNNGDDEDGSDTDPEKKRLDSEQRLRQLRLQPFHPPPRMNYYESRTHSEDSPVYADYSRRTSEAGTTI